MKISTKSRYGLRMLAQISVDTETGNRVSGKELAAKQELSIGYMEQILIPLRNSGLITTVRGRNGGYLLNRLPESITLLELIEIFEGKLELVDSHECNNCNQENNCVSRDVWQHLTDTLRNECEKITVAEIANKLKAKQHCCTDFVI